MLDERKVADLFAELACSVVADRSMRSALDTLLGRVVDLLPVDSAGVTLISDELQPRYVAAFDETAVELEELQSHFQEGPCIAAYRSRRPVLVPDLSEEARFPRFVPAAQRAGLRAVFTFPLRSGESFIGAFDLYGYGLTSLDDREVAVAQGLADVAAAVVINARDRDATHIAVEHLGHDPLTGLANRSLLQEQLECAAERAARWNTSAALVFVDINGLQEITNRYGAGLTDRLLIAVAERLASQVGPDDTLARVAADEFAVLRSDVDRIADVASLIDTVHELFAAPFTVADTQLVLTVRVQAINPIGHDYSRGPYATLTSPWRT